MTILRYALGLLLVLPLLAQAEPPAGGSYTAINWTLFNSGTDDTAAATKYANGTNSDVVYSLTSQAWDEHNAIAGQLSAPGSNSKGTVANTSRTTGDVTFGRISLAIDGSATASTYGTSMGASYAQGIWSDQITLKSNTLATGTPVDITMASSFDRTIDGTAPAVANATVFASAWADFTSPAACDAAGGGGFSMCVTGNASQTLKTIVHAKVGDVLSIGGNVWMTSEADAVVNAGRVTDSNSFLIDAGSTQLFALSVTTPGAFYQAASGTTYLASLPVPEADAWAMLVAGLAVMGAVTLRKRKTA